jgi:hypothetical protein
MIITISIMGTVIVGLVHLNIQTKNKLKQEEREHVQVMESFCILAVKYFIVTNNKTGIEEARKRGFNIQEIKNSEVKVKVFKNER